MVSRGQNLPDEWPMLPPRARMSSRPKVLLGVMSGCLTQLQLLSVLMTVSVIFDPPPREATGRMCDEIRGAC